MLHRYTKAGVPKRRSQEDLVLGDRTKVPGHIVQYLTSFQLHGIRFLHKHFVDKSNCILNDDKYLGKCFQTTVFLSAICATNNFAFKCLILCKSREKLLNWLYHIELLTDLNPVEINSIVDFQNSNVLLQVIEEIHKKTNLLTTKLWDYVIFDETGENAFTDSDIAVLNQIETKVKLIVSTRDITRDVRHLERLLLLLNGSDYAKDVFKRIISKLKKRDNHIIRIRELLICYCKNFRLRRYRREIKDGLPLTDYAIYHKNFNYWLSSKGIMPSETVDACKTQINQQNNLEHSQNTEEMEPLLLESDSEDEFDEIRNIMKYERKSSDVEILTQKLPSPITLSSENRYQQSSPDLFESLDEDDSEKTTTYELTGSLFKFKKKLNNEKVSTPIITSTTQWSSLKQQNSEDLFEGITTMIEVEEDDTHIDNGKLFEESNRTCVFEITKNDEFPNVIRINSDTEMSPLNNYIPPPKLPIDTPNSKARNSCQNQKLKNFHYFFDHDEQDIANAQNSIEVIDAEKSALNNICVTPKSSKTPNTSGSSSNSNRWICKSTSSVKRKISDSFEKRQSKRLKNHDIIKLQDNSNKNNSEKKSLSSFESSADSCSIFFKKSKFKRFLSHSPASADEDF